MGLCLCIFNEDGDDIAECEVGHYSDFGFFRETIANHLEAQQYPVLMNHSDCDGEWSVAELQTLRNELEQIAQEFRAFPPEQLKGVFEHTAAYRVNAKSLYECFHNPSGENLFEALSSLCMEGIKVQRPISFQ
jgi:Immunity protein 70